MTAALRAVLAVAAAVSTAGAAEMPTLYFGVEWRLIRAGAAKLQWTPAPHGGHQADLHLESAGLVSKLYRVDDDYRAIMDSAFCVSSVALKAEEGKRRRDTRIAFSGGRAHYLERDLVKNETVLTKDIDVAPCTHEYMGGLQKLRSLRLNPGQSVQIPLSDGKKFANVKVEAQERERISTPAGSFNAMRYEIGLFNKVLIDRNARLYVWISEDSLRLPVQIRVRMAFLIGTITLQLEKVEGAAATSK